MRPGPECSHLSVFSCPKCLPDEAPRANAALVAMNSRATHEMALELFHSANKEVLRLTAENAVLESERDRLQAELSKKTKAKRRKK